MNSERLFMNHEFEKVKAFAYVTIGPLTDPNYKLLKLEIVGPAQPDPTHRVMRYRGIESVFIPMQVTPACFEMLRQGALVNPNKDHTLWLSLRSLSLDPEMRFRLNRAFMEEDTKYPVGAPK